MSTDLTIVMTLCNRPHYTKRVLDMLARCDGCSDVPVTLCVEPGNDAVLNLALGFRHPCTVVQNKRKLGCNTNTFMALSMGFEKADRVIALEDDTLPGRDFITFMRWALDKYEDDKSVFSVSGYQRTQQHEITRTLDVVRENWFTPWGWGSWRDRWIECCDNWPALDEQISWDTVIHKMRLGDRCEVRPVVARIQNIGAEGGLHVPSREWHRDHHLNPYWIEVSEPVNAASEFAECEPLEHQLRATYPC